MILNLRKLIFIIIFNSSLFLVLIIGIQNSNFKSKINLLVNETVELPIGFIMGIGFISGSITGSLLSISSNENNY
tara:strand:- start:638 stop:862 length:225 start_codon:yes stop_codon:yes gene_type:complete